MKIFLDDVRGAPDVSWILVRTAQEAIDILIDRDGNVAIISLDHDLGTAQTGYDVAKWIEENADSNCNYFPPVIQIHSANPVGRKNIQACIESIYRIVTNRYNAFEWGCLYGA